MNLDCESVVAISRQAIHQARPGWYFSGASQSQKLLHRLEVWNLGALASLALSCAPTGRIQRHPGRHNRGFLYFPQLGPTGIPANALWGATSGDSFCSKPFGQERTLDMGALSRAQGSLPGELTRYVLAQGPQRSKLLVSSPTNPSLPRLLFTLNPAQLQASNNITVEWEPLQHEARNFLPAQIALLITRRHSPLSYRSFSSRHLFSGLRPVFVSDLCPLPRPSLPPQRLLLIPAQYWLASCKSRVNQLEVSQICPSASQDL